MGKSRENRFNAKARSAKRGDVAPSSAAQLAQSEQLASVVDKNILGSTGEGSNTLVLPSSRVKEAKVASAPAKKALSTKQKRRMQAFVEKQIKKERRVDLMEKLSVSTFAVANTNLMRSTKDLGKKDSLKDRLRRSLLEERAGLPISDSQSRLLVPIDSKKRPHNEDEDEVEIIQEEKPTEDTPKKKKKKKQANKKVPEETAMESTPIVTEKEPEEPLVAVVEKTPAVVVEKTPAIVIEKKPAFYVPVKRDPAVQAQRIQLPIITEEQVIMETINENSFIIIAGETGSGKTTQVPQFLYEAGYGNPDSDHPGKIGITQPRRVAAVAMTARVARELNVPKDRVSYQIRYDGTVSPSTIIQFMTDGVLLKEIANDFLLKNYSVIILDEAHERNLNTDILIGLLSRLVPLRDKLVKEDKGLVGPNGRRLCPLKVIIMSATLREKEFTENKALFPLKPPPVINIDARQYPVAIHFQQKTPLDYISAAFTRVCKIHTRLPPGGILVFVTGQNEIEALCRKLRARFPTKDQKKKGCEEDEGVQLTRKGSSIPVADEAKEMVMGLEEDTGLLESDDADEVLNKIKDESEEDQDEDHRPLYVLPLYALLAPSQQLRVFEPVPEGHRLCVVATNVAETSITIPNIKYVVDTGKAKERHHDATTGIQSFKVEWISQASAKQRAGRAGRTGPGHCYRLYSSSVFSDVENFPEFSKPEIERIPIEATVLLMKAMNIDNVVNFPFPTAPKREAVAQAEKLLVMLGALSDSLKTVTPLGRQMAAFPLSPRFSKMILVSEAYKMSEYVIALVAALAVGDPFIRDPHEEEAEQKGQETDVEKKEQRRLQRAQYRRAHERFAPGDDFGDLHKLLNVVIAYEAAKVKDAFCDENLLRSKSMNEISKLRAQLTNIANTLRGELSSVLLVQSNLPPPSAAQKRLLSQIVLSAFMDQIATRRTDVAEGPAGACFRALATEEEVYIHPTSVLHLRRPDWIIYMELVKTTRLYVKGVTVVAPKWLSKIAPSLCYFGKPLENPPPRYDSEKDCVMCFCSPTYGPLSWPLPPVEVPFPHGLDLFKYFARFLLEGEVCPALAQFVPSLVSKPSTVNKTWTQPKILDLVQPLQQHDISSRTALEAKWKTNPTFLLNAYLAWLEHPQQSTARSIWPPITITPKRTQKSLKK